MLPKLPIFRAAQWAVWQSTWANAISQCQLKAYIRKVDCQGLMAFWQLAVDVRAKGLLQPAFLHNAHCSHFHAQRIATQFRHQVELVHLGGRVDVVMIAEVAQPGPSPGDLQSTGQGPAMILEAVPGQAGTVIEADFHDLA